MACSSCGKSHAKKAGMAPAPSSRQAYNGGRKTYSASTASAHGSPKIRFSGRGR